MANESKQTVLVVDDEHLVVNMIVTALNKLGIDSITAEDGIVAVEKFRDHHKSLSLVILDVNMPRMGGRDALIKMRELNSEVPILISSGFNEGEILSDDEHAHANGTLVKPYNSEELIKAIEDTIAK